jgi:hypothetical protein
MKKVLFLIVFFTGIVSFPSVFGQNVTAPSWIRGTWHNLLESNTNNFVYWTFSNDSIFIENGLNINESDRKCLNTEYAGYKKSEYSGDSLYQVNFTKGNQAVVYEFKLHKVEFTNKPAFTYSLTINGITKVKHSTSSNLLMIKN